MTEKSEESQLYDRLQEECKDMWRKNASQKGINKAKRVIFEDTFKCNNLDLIYDTIEPLYENYYIRNVIKDSKKISYFASEIFHFRLKEATDNFTQLLSECNLSHKTTYEEFAHNYGNDQRFLKIRDKGKRITLFGNFMADIAPSREPVDENEDTDDDEEEKDEIVTSKKEIFENKSEILNDNKVKISGKRFPCQLIRMGKKCPDETECIFAHSPAELVNNDEARDSWQKEIEIKSKNAKAQELRDKVAKYVRKDKIYHCILCDSIHKPNQINDHIKAGHKVDIEVCYINTDGVPMPEFFHNESCHFYYSDNEDDEEDEDANLEESIEEPKEKL